MLVAGKCILKFVNYLPRILHAAQQGVVMRPDHFVQLLLDVLAIATPVFPAPGGFLDRSRRDSLALAQLQSSRRAGAAAAARNALGRSIRMLVCDVVLLATSAFQADRRPVGERR